MNLVSMFHRLFQKKHKPQTAASERTFEWMPICPTCYAIRHPGRDPYFANDKREICCDCGRHTLTAMYVSRPVKEETNATA